MGTQIALFTLRRTSALSYLVITAFQRTLQLNWMQVGDKFLHDGLAAGNTRRLENTGNGDSRRDGFRDNAVRRPMIE
jgi:hypothetical protein